jgi:uncharacterized protein YggT (Ycf19 family)
MQYRPPASGDEPTWPGYTTPLPPPPPQPQPRPARAPSAPAPQQQQYFVGAPYERSVQSAYRPPRPPSALVSRTLYALAQIISLVVGIIEALLLVRIILLLFGANPDAGFSSWVYGHTDSLVAPFQGVFSTIGGGSGPMIDVAAILAMIVYALAGRIVGAVIRGLARL